MQLDNRAGNPPPPSMDVSLQFGALRTQELHWDMADELLNSGHFIRNSAHVPAFLGTVNRKTCMGGVCNLLCGVGRDQSDGDGKKSAAITQSLFLLGLSGHRKSSMFRTCIANDSTKALWRPTFSPLLTRLHNFQNMQTKTYVKAFSPRRTRYGSL